MAKLDRLFKIDFYPQDWLIDTARMENDERGIYVQIVMMMYSNRGPIVNDPSWIGRAANLSATKAKNLINRLISSAFLTEIDGKLHQKRTQNEIESKTNHIENSSKGGKLSGGHNRKDNDLEASDIPKPLASPSPIAKATTKAIASSDDKSSLSRRVSKPPDAYTDNFLEFWNTYPKNHGSKAGAFTAYNRAISKGVKHEIIIAGAGRYAGHCETEGTGERYVAHGSTWLNGKRWELDYAASSRPSGSANGRNPRGKAEVARSYSNQAVAEMGDFFEGRQAGDAIGG